MTIKNILIGICLLMFCRHQPAQAASLSKEQLYSVYSQANDSFRQANSTKNDDERKKLYEKAILGFEKIISEGRIANAGLYYNLGNAYFLDGNIGKAVLNYRRAEKLDNANPDIQKNLSFARSRRIDKVEVKTEDKVMQTLFFWHYDFSLKSRFMAGCICFAVFCVSLTIMIWLGRKVASLTVLAAICGIFAAAFLCSVAVEYHQQANSIYGVITANEIVARQGDGQNYPASFKEPLHAGTEFKLLEKRPGWVHVRLSDSSDGWIPDNAAELI